MLCRIDDLVCGLATQKLLKTGVAYCGNVYLI